MTTREGVRPASSLCRAVAVASLEVLDRPLVVHQHLDHLAVQTDSAGTIEAVSSSLHES